MLGILVHVIVSMINVVIFIDEYFKKNALVQEELPMI